MLIYAVSFRAQMLKSPGWWQTPCLAFLCYVKQSNLRGSKQTSSVCVGFIRVNLNNLCSNYFSSWTNISTLLLMQFYTRGEKGRMKIKSHAYNYKCIYSTQTGSTRDRNIDWVIFLLTIHYWTKLQISDAYLWMDHGSSSSEGIGGAPRCRW